MQKHEETLIIASATLTQSQIKTLDKLQTVTGKTRSELLREACEYLFQIYKTDLTETQTA